MRREDVVLYKKSILLGCSTRPMSAKELSENFHIPIGTCYRIIRILLSERVLKCSLTVTKNGRTIPLFRTSPANKYAIERKHREERPATVAQL